MKSANNHGITSIDTEATSYLLEREYLTQLTHADHLIEDLVSENELLRSENQLLRQWMGKET